MIDAPLKSASPVRQAEDPVIAVCESHESALGIVETLHLAGWDMTHVSLVGRSNVAPTQSHGIFDPGDRIKNWASKGSLWGAGWGLLLGAAIVVMPPAGVVTVAGPIVTVLISVLEGAAVIGGVSAIAAALAEIGMSSEHAATYEAQVQADRFLVIVHGTPADMARAREIAIGRGH